MWQEERTSLIDSCLKRKADKARRYTGGSTGFKQGNGYSQAHSEEIKALKAQVAALVEASKANNENQEDNPVAMFAAIRSTLEEIAASPVNSSESEYLYTDLPRTIIDGG